MCEIIKIWTPRVYYRMWRIPTLSDDLPIVFCSSVLLKSQALSLRIASSNWPEGKFSEIIILLSITIARHHTGASNNGPDRTSSTADAKLDLILNADGSFRIIACPDVPFVKYEHNITSKQTACSHTLLHEKSSSEWWCADVRKTASKEDYHQETEVRSESNAIYEVDCQEVLHGHSVGIIQFCCNFAWTSPRLSFHVCNYGVFLSGVCTDRVRLPFVSAVGATLNVSRRDCCNRRNTFPSGWRRRTLHRICAPATLQARLLQAPRIIRSELSLLCAIRLGNT